MLWDYLPQSEEPDVEGSGGASPLVNPMQTPGLKHSWPKLALFTGPVEPTEDIVHDTSLLANKSFVHYNEPCLYLGSTLKNWWK